MFDLTGRKALVTGATGGIGEEIARALHAQGATLGLHGTRREKLESLAAELGGNTRIFTANLTDRAAVRELARTAEAELGGVDILVNNAGITNDGLMMRMSDEDWDKVIDINLNATFVLTRELCGPMMKRRYGRVVNISSVVAAIGNPGQANYCASKAGLEGFTKAFAAEVASRNIMANCVSPGFIESAMTEKLNDKQKETLFVKIPMKRMGLGKEVAAAVCFLASEECSYITGHVLHVNGGMAML
jgi:3-oxoacyl-[acyl-carrier protein] reductase